VRRGVKTLTSGMGQLLQACGSEGDI